MQKTVHFCWEQYRGLYHKDGGEGRGVLVAMVELMMAWGWLVEGGTAKNTDSDLPNGRDFGSLPLSFA